MLNCAIIGVGGLGKVHLSNVERLAKQRGDINLVALCDIEKERITAQTKTNLSLDLDAADMSKYNLYTDAREMLEKERLDFVISAVPTYVHKEIAVMALQKGVHVLSEKPMALDADECQCMIDAANENGKLLMIGQCLRHSAEYKFLKELIDSKKYGNVVRAEFYRHSPFPSWTWQGWMTTYEKSGGAALDMHVHDVDMINWLFGMPPSVTSFATHAKMPFEAITTTYNYSDKLVTATGDWGMPDDFKFRYGFVVRFENAIAESHGGKLRIVTNTETISPEIAGWDFYEGEVAYFADCILSGEPVSVAPPESSMEAIKIVRAEMESANSGTSVTL